MTTTGWAYFAVLGNITMWHGNFLTVFHSLQEFWPQSSVFAASKWTFFSPLRKNLSTHLIICVISLSSCPRYACLDLCIYICQWFKTIKNISHEESYSKCFHYILPSLPHDTRLHSRLIPNSCRGVKPFLQYLHKTLNLICRNILLIHFNFSV